MAWGPPCTVHHLEPWVAEPVVESISSFSLLGEGWVGMLLSSSHQARFLLAAAALSALWGVSTSRAV